MALGSDIAARLERLEVDRERMAEVFANLLANALRHTAPGGTVTASVAQRSEVVEFAVADNGEGIPFEHLAACS